MYFVCVHGRSWILPFIGHAGIGAASGLTFDFAGPHFINSGRLAFGRTLKYWRLDPRRIPAHVIERMGASSPLHAWDMAVEESNRRFKNLNHNICCQNCHHHVARVLSILEYDGKTSWSQVAIAWQLVLHGRYVSCGTFLQVYIPFLIILGIALTLGLLL